MQLGEVNMDFAYADYFGVTPSTGYERLLHDCMIGDATLFPARRHGRGWLEHRQSGTRRVEGAASGRNFPNYPAGTWGPKEADELMDRRWAAAGEIPRNDSWDFGVIS